VKLICEKYAILFLMLVVIIFSTGEILCQDSEELARKKKDNIEKLNYSKDLLDKTVKSKSVTLSQLELIKKGIELRAGLIDNISEELLYLKDDIDENNHEISRIESKIDKIRKEYESLIIAASRNLDNEYALMYIFSSQDFNQAYQRIKYLKYLAKFREELVNELVAEEENLKAKNIELITNKRKNERLLNERKIELVELDTDKKKNLTLVRTLQNKESVLKKEIQKRERIQSQIEMEIRKIIEEEAAKARSANKANILTPEEKLISTDFNKNMGRLPWPSEQGVLTGKYGEQNHPVLKGIKIRSNGIDINTIEGTKIRSVFDGEVTKVIAILGANYTVIIKHGEYRTVYQNLVDVRVKAGERVKTKDIIGTVFTDQEKISKFHFELWKDKVTQNPEFWLSK